MKRNVMCIGGFVILSFLLLIGSASATLLFRVGEVDGNVNPIIGADEFAANNDYDGRQTIDFGSLAFTGDVQNELLPGYLSVRRIGDIVSDGRPLTDATSSYQFAFELTSDYTDMLFTYGRYGSETDEIVSDLYLNGNPFNITGPGEGNYQVLNFDLGDLCVDNYLITVNYLGGGFGNGHYIDFFELNGNMAAVPEASTMILLGTGLLGLAGWGRRKFWKQ